MTVHSAALAVPGDLMSPTGGYLYDRRLLSGLRALGRDVLHVPLSAAFPDPTSADNRDAARRLAALASDCPVIIDGLALGAMDREVLANTAAPIVALVHHPLAHESGLDAQRRAELKRRERDNLTLAAQVIVTSPHTAALLASEYGVSPDRITVARPGSDAAPDTVAPADPPLILSVGIQVPRKGHDVLLGALASVTDRRWQAVIVGEARNAPHAGTLRALAADPRLAGRVRLAGHVTHEELAALYGRASLFALATRYEGYGIVFDEAVRHGLPIVSCAVGAVPDTVDPDAAILVPPDDRRAFATALGRILDDPGARDAMARAARDAGAALPGWDDTARRVAAVLDRVATHG